jgi:acyl carrier protein
VITRSSGRAFLAERLGLDATSESRDDELLWAGLIDSADPVLIATFFEQKLGNRIPDRDINASHFDSIAQILCLRLSAALRLRTALDQRNVMKREAAKFTPVAQRMPMAWGMTFRRKLKLSSSSFRTSRLTLSATSEKPTNLT